MVHSRNEIDGAVWPACQKKEGPSQTSMGQYKINFKGSYLDFSHLIELKSIHITEIYMKNNTNHQ